ncbi:hypothetical protein MNBD_GAMMA04-79 [hydrothermal vent metagenome]|uniref:Carboxypeptidase regulatory-like domain-containing protein n=1 Tax=hydrothermal vent metagenome TaxID=652676 RepID=A0A3B0VV93_9ZZZZ
MKTSKSCIVIFVLLLSYLFSMTSFAESLKGQVVDRHDVPVPGMEVRLYHPDPGVSRPRYTDRDGIFFFNYVPPVNGYYDIEYYWRGELIYRGSVQVIGNVQLPPIIL